VITGPDGRAPAQVITSSPPTQTEDICKLIVVAQSDDADRPLSAVDTPSSRHPHPFVDQFSIPEKMDQGCRKDNRIPEFSGVISASAPHPRRISASQTPCGPVLQHARQPSRRHRIRPQPGRWTYLASPPAPAPSQFQRPMANPNSARGQRAVQLRNTATPPTNTGPQRPPLAGDLRK
jgi:hypothetical protein